MDANSKAIFELNANWQRMIDAKDIDGIIDLYRPDGAFLLSGQPAFEGHEAVRGAWQFLFGLPEFSLVLNPSFVEVSGDTSFAMDMGTYRLSYRGPEEPVVQVGNYLVVWRAAEDGAWKVAVDIVNDAPVASI
ncbi:MAG TPA: DUF4440 domain-containing protein [Rhizorhapis sp.]|nr:DUF4440 domain-containing protein [Rhizorhapis sp.]